MREMEGGTEMETKGRVLPSSPPSLLSFLLASPAPLPSLFPSFPSFCECLSIYLASGLMLGARYPLGNPAVLVPVPEERPLPFSGKRIHCCDRTLQQVWEYLISVPKLVWVVRGGFLEEVTSGLGSDDTEVLGGGWGWEGWFGMVCAVLSRSVVSHPFPPHGL